MSADSASPAYKPNPDYGRGAFWRRIDLANRDGLTEAALEDNSHAMRCRLTHASGRITAIKSQMLRVPMNICPGAEGKLEELVGESLAVPYRAYFGSGRAALNCSHLYDLAWLAIGHASRESARRRFDVTIPDAIAGMTIIGVEVDGALIHHWHVDHDHVVSPGPLCGASLKSGFIRRALEGFSGDDLEAALVLYKGYIVAGGRRKLLDSATPPPAADLARRNACYAFGEERVADAKRIWSRRPFNGPGEFTIFDLPWDSNFANG